MKTAIQNFMSEVRANFSSMPRKAGVKPFRILTVTNPIVFHAMQDLKFKGLVLHMNNKGFRAFIVCIPFDYKYPREFDKYMKRELNYDQFKHACKICLDAEYVDFRVNKKKLSLTRQQEIEAINKFVIEHNIGDEFGLNNLFFED